MKRFVNIAFITLLLILAMSISASAKEAENITENLSFTFENIDGGVLFDDLLTDRQKEKIFSLNAKKLLNIK